MLRFVLLPLAFALMLVSADAQAQRRSHPVGQPRSSDDVKLAPGMRLGRPLALTTDYMGRPLKPKPARPVPGKGASSISAKSAPTTAAPATKTKTTTTAVKRRRR